MKKIIETSGAPAPIGPYSQAVQAGDTLYVSGQIPMDMANGGEIPSGIAEQTRVVMTNLQAILTEAGFTFANVVKCSIFITNMDDFAQINGVYGEYFPENPPARETVQVSRLPKDVNVEISCIAVA